MCSFALTLQGWAQLVTFWSTHVCVCVSVSVSVFVSRIIMLYSY